MEFSSNILPWHLKISCNFKKWEDVLHGLIGFDQKTRWSGLRRTFTFHWLTLEKEHSLSGLQIPHQYCLLLSCFLEISWNFSGLSGTTHCLTVFNNLRKFYFIWNFSKGYFFFFRVTNAIISLKLNDFFLWAKIFHASGKVNIYFYFHINLPPIFRDTVPHQSL